MKEIEFYSKNHRPGMWSRIFSFLLLSAGASSLMNLQKATLGDKLYIKKFLENEVALDYSELEIKYGEGNNPIGVQGKTHFLPLNELRDPEGFIEELKKRI